LALHPLLEIRNLSIAYFLNTQIIRAVQNTSLQISPGETLALVGETGSGKSTLALAVLGLLGRQARVESGEILFEGRDLQQLSRRDWKSIRSRKIGVAFQDARSSLNPVLKIRDHLIETLRTHQRISRKEAHARSQELLEEVGIPKGREKLYPFDLSGGECQRVGIALAICNNPRLLIADEPVSAVDVTLQAQLLDLLQLMKQRYNLALFLISHDLPLISVVADRITVMYHGRIIESGLRDEIFAFPAHPYTQGLIQSQPDLKHHHERLPLTSIPGAAPIPGETLQGCMFAPRCREAEPGCNKAVPAGQALSETHWVACFRESKTWE
jgi:oligopeptide/dipeptide ABC transporter ATP-binding protein